MVWHATKPKLLLTWHPTETKLSLTWHPIIAKSIIQVVTILHTKRVMEQGWEKVGYWSKGLAHTHAIGNNIKTLLGGMTLTTQCYIMVILSWSEPDRIIKHGNRIIGLFPKKLKFVFDIENMCITTWTCTPTCTDFTNTGIQIYTSFFHLNMLLSSYFWWAVTKIKVSGTWRAVQKMLKILLPFSPRTSIP